MGFPRSDWPTRGFIDAYEAPDAKLAWRFYTVPRAAEPSQRNVARD